VIEPYEFPSNEDKKEEDPKILAMKATVVH